MIVLELDTVEIDHCLDCGGAWFDVGELEWIIEQAGGLAGTISEQLRADRKGEASTRRCPRCRRFLHGRPVGANRSITLDGCTHGHGVWVERGDMQALIAEFSAGPQAAVGRFLSDLFPVGPVEQDKGR